MVMLHADQSQPSRMKVSIAVDMQNSSEADRRLVTELMPLMR